MRSAAGPLSGNCAPQCCGCGETNLGDNEERRRVRAILRLAFFQTCHVSTYLAVPVPVTSDRTPMKTNSLTSTKAQVR